MRSLNRAAALAAALALLVAACGAGRAEAKAASVCVSSGDTHLYPFGGQSRFDIYNPRPFVLTAYNTRDHARRFEAQATQAYGAWGSRTVDNNLAVRCGRDLVVFRQARNGHVPSMKVNGVAHSVASGRRFHFPSSPANSRSRYYIEARHSSAWHTFTINCNHRGYEKGYAFGFKVAVQWFRPWHHWWYRRHNPTRYVHANVQVETQSRYAWKLERGACGWNRGGAQPRGQNHLIAYRGSLFSKTPADHAREAKAGRKLTDPARLRAAQAKCARAIYKSTGVTLQKAVKYFGRIDKNVAKTVAAFIHGCAIDTYFGVGHNTADMAGAVCNWVSMASDSVYQDTVRAIHHIRSCKKPWRDPKTLLPMLEEKFRLAQFCNSNPPKQRDALPGGIGFNPTCADVEKRHAAVKKLSEEQKAKAGVLSRQKQEQVERAAAEQRAKAGEKGKLEEEQKKIEAEKEETDKLEAKAREDLQKRAQAAAQGSKVPLERVSKLKPGTVMTQKSKVFMMDATQAAGSDAAAEAAAAAAKPAEAASSSEDSDAAAADDGSADLESSAEDSGEAAATPVA